jgi:sulfate permease, SulP family
VDWLRHYRRDWLGRDLLAGVTAGAVVIPQAMGYATVAGLPVEMGLYTCMVPMLVYALLGGARRLSMSTTSTIVALTGVGLVAALGTGAPQAEIVGTAITLTFLVGVAVLLFWVLRLGWVVDAISDTVLIGLKVGVGFTILASQLPDLFGIESSGEGFFGNVGNALANLSEANPTTVVISVVTIGGLLALKRWQRRVPGPLLALAGGILLVTVFNVDQPGVVLIPEVPRGLAPVVVPPTEHVPVLIPYALAIGLLAYMETIAVGRSTRQPTDPPLVNNQESFAAGAASVAGAFFQAVPAGSRSRWSMPTPERGTQLSELVTAGLAVGVALFLAPVLSDCPKPRWRRSSPWRFSV